jgi:hypothetical protein
MAGTSASDSKSSRYGISTASSAAPSGVRKTAEMPAATPASTRTRRSRRVAGTTLASAEPMAPPICIVGPSRPPDPPLPSASTEATNLSGATRLRIRPPRW